MANKRFQKTERAIFVAYYKLRDFPSARKVARRAKISCSTFYRHHSSPYHISQDYENYLLKSYSSKIKKLINAKNTETNTVFLRTLVFVTAHRVIYKALFKNGQKEIIKRMFRVLRQKIITEWQLPGDLEKLYNVYENEIVGLFEVWDKQNFSSRYLDAVLNDLIYLTKTTPKRLAKIAKNSLK